MIYLDSCALVALTVGRAPREELVEYLAGFPNVPLGTSTLGFMETVRTAALYGQYPNMMAELESACSELIVTREIRDLTAHLPGKIRTMDATHVATAVSIEEYLTVLVSYDRRLLEAARAQGLPVASPGMNL